MCILIVVAAVLLSASARADGYALLTVTQDGKVSYAHGFASQHMCEEAKSVAVYGQTIEALKTAEEAATKKSAEFDARLATEPGREPRLHDAYDQRLVKDADAIISPCGYSPYDTHEVYRTSDHRIHNVRNMCWMGDTMNFGPSFKIAECIVDTDPSK